MKTRLSENECKLVELVQAVQPIGTYEIRTRLGLKDSILNYNLARLVMKNYISKREEDGVTSYFVADHNKHAIILNVVCPRCNVHRKISDAQYIVRCKTWDCKTASGKRTVYWAKSRIIKPQKVVLQ